MSQEHKDQQQQQKQSHNKSNVQYVAKVRYSNNLPPPSCPPKLLNYSSNDDAFKSLLSSFFRKENFKNLITLNDDLGMSMNFLELPDPDTVYGIDGLTLHPNDKLLLTDPLKKIETKSENVSFLRRTQYISSDISSVSTADIRFKMRKEDELDPKIQLKLIEDMFNQPIKDLTRIKHPTKKNLKAKKIWNFLPDTSMFDQTYYDVKFLSSASISKNKNQTNIKSINDPKLLTSMFREIELNKNLRLVSFYTTTDSNSEEIKEGFEDETENAPITEAEVKSEDLKSFVYKKQRDYDGTIKSVEPLRQLVITLDENTNNAYYIPINGKLELKKCRIDPYLIPKIKELTYDQVHLSVREPTKAEIDNRDMMRSNYDPMEFGDEE